MAVTLGRQARIKIDDTVVAFVQNVSLAIGNRLVPITSLGDTWDKFSRTMRGATLSFSAFINKADTKQAELMTAAENGTLLQGLQFFLDSTARYEIDVDDDEYDVETCGVYVDSFTVTAENENVIMADMSITFSGPVEYSTS